MGQNNIQREPVTDADITRYREMIKKGDSGIAAMYDELEQKGYASASWLKDEYSKNTVYGTNTNLFFKNQTGQNITPELAIRHVLCSRLLIKKFLKAEELLMIWITQK